VNIQRCRVNGLPHPMLARQGLVDTQPYVRGKKPIVQLGTLKRLREDSEDPHAVFERAVQKKARYELAKQLCEIPSRKRKRQEDGELESCPMSDEMPGVSEGPNILTNAEYLARLMSMRTPGQAGPSSSSPTLRGILRKKPPVPLVSYNRDLWVGTIRETSPKLGPLDLHIPKVGRRAMLGVHYDALADDEETDEGVSELFRSHQPDDGRQLGEMVGRLDTDEHATGHAAGHTTEMRPPKMQRESTSGRWLHSSPASTDEEDEEAVSRLLQLPPLRIDVATPSLSWMGSLLRWIH
jgi:hypothetical protein